MNIYKTSGDLLIEIENEKGYEKFYTDFHWCGEYENLEYETEEEALEYIEEYVKELLKDNSWNLFTEWVESRGFNLEKHGEAQITVTTSILDIDIEEE